MILKVPLTEVDIFSRRDWSLYSVGPEVTSSLLGQKRFNSGIWGKTNLPSSLCQNTKCHPSILEVMMSHGTHHWKGCPSLMLTVSPPCTTTTSCHVGPGNPITTRWGLVLDLQLISRKHPKVDNPNQLGRYLTSF